MCSSDYFGVNSKFQSEEYPYKNKKNQGDIRPHNYLLIDTMNKNELKDFIKGNPEWRDKGFTDQDIAFLHSNL